MSTKIDPKRIEAWLRDMGCEPSVANDPMANWRYDMAFPPGAPHKMAVLNPKRPARAVIIATGVSLAAEQHVAFDQLDDDARHEFLLDLQGTLNRDHVEYQLQGITNPIVACPTGFQITAVIFDDGLTLDALASRMSSVFKAELAGSFCVQRHIGHGGTGGSGQFDFRRIGIQ